MKHIKIFKTLKDDLKNQTSYSVKYLQSNEINRTLSKDGIKRRKIFAPILRKIYLTQTPYKLKKDNKNTQKISPKNKKIGKIFVVNHRQADDIVLAANAIGESGYFVFGNKYLALETLNGLGLWAYGMILLDRENKESRKATYSKIKYVLNHGGNIIIFPEGYWNLDDNGEKDKNHGADAHNSENWLIQDINIGIVRAAQETQAPIIPCVLHYDEYGSKMCYSKKTNPIYILPQDDIFVKKDEVVEAMQTAYYSLMEKYSSYERDILESSKKTLKEQWQELKEELIKACSIASCGYELDLNDEKRIGKAKVAKPVITQNEVYEKVKKITK